MAVRAALLSPLPTDVPGFESDRTPMPTEGMKGISQIMNQAGQMMSQAAAGVCAAMESKGGSISGSKGGQCGGKAEGNSGGAENGDGCEAR